MFSVVSRFVLSAIDQLAIASPQHGQRLNQVGIRQLTQNSRKRENPVSREILYVDKLRFLQFIPFTFLRDHKFPLCNLNLSLYFAL
jgi:hypothetical protein